MDSLRPLLARVTSKSSRRTFFRGLRELAEPAFDLFKFIPLLLALAFFYQYFHERIIVKPFTVTKALNDAGVTDVVVAEELRQRIYAIYYNASLDDRRDSGVALAPELPEISVPESGISITAIVDFLAAELPWKTRSVISGGFINEDGRLRLETFVDGKEAYSGSVAAKSGTHDGLLDAAADAVVERTKPLSRVADLIRRNRSRDAYRFLSQLIDASSLNAADTAQAYQLRAITLRDEGRFGEACDEFLKSLRIDPSSGATYENLSLLLSDEREYGAATAEAEKAVVLTWGRDPWSYYYLGNRYYAERRWADAERAYRHAIRLWFKHPFAHDALGQVLRNERNPDESLAELNVAIAVNGASAKAFEDLGELLVELQRFPDARDAFVQASAIDPTLDRPHVGLGAIYYRKGNYRLAAAEFMHALRLDRGNSYAYAGLEHSLLQDPSVAGDDRTSRIVKAGLDGVRACGAVPSTVSGFFGGMMREMVRLRCDGRAALATATARPSGVCRADPPDATPFQVASRMALMPATSLLYWFAFTDWLADHAGSVVVFVVVALFVWYLWSRRRFDPGSAA